MVGAFGISARDNDRSLNAERRQFPGIRDGDLVHASLGSEIWSEERWNSAGDAAARDPDQQAAAGSAHMRQNSAVHALRAEHIDVVKRRELFSREGFQRSDDHVSRIVHQNVELAMLFDNLRNRSVNGGLILDVEFD